MRSASNHTCADLAALLRQPASKSDQPDRLRNNANDTASMISVGIR